MIPFKKTTTGAILEGIREGASFFLILLWGAIELMAQEDIARKKSKK